MNIREIAAYLGIRGELPRETLETIKSVYPIAESLTGSYRTAEFSLSFTEHGILLGGTDIVLSGNLAEKTFAGCNRIFVVLATLGLQSEQILRRQFSESPERAVVLDACFTERLERILDGWEETLPKERGADITRRISPGYGDLSLSLQKKLIGYLQPERLGVAMGESFMMYPNKTVIALVGGRGQR